VIIGRTIGWLMVVLAIMMASGEAVMALGASSYPGLATSEIVTLLVGQPLTMSLATMPDLLAALGTGLLAMPAWLVIGAFGLCFTQLCRTRRARRRRFRAV
jgi:hypothetical protein